MRQPANAHLLEQAMFLNKLFDEKTFSWTLAMEDLETVLPGGVQVTTLEPARAKDGQITLRLRVIGPRDHAVELVRNLEHSKRFLHPRIVGENASDATAAPNQHLAPVSASDRFDFDLLAEYNPAGPEERKATRKLKPLDGEKEQAPTAAPREVHPLPLPAPGQGRPPYTGPVPPMNRVPLGRGPATPGAPPPPVPTDRPHGGPQ